jgi:hypothetical protein
VLMYRMRWILLLHYPYISWHGDNFERDGKTHPHGHRFSKDTNVSQYSGHWPRGEERLEISDVVWSCSQLIQVTLADTWKLKSRHLPGRNKT